MLLAVEPRCAWRGTKFLLSYNNHGRILGEGAFKINILCFSVVVRKKLCRGIFPELSHLKGLWILLLVENGYLKSQVSWIQKRPAKTGLDNPWGNHFKSIVVHAHCDRIVEIVAFHHLYYLVLFMVTSTSSGICFSDWQFRQVFWMPR